MELLSNLLFHLVASILLIGIGYSLGYKKSEENTIRRIEKVKRVGE